MSMHNVRFPGETDEYRTKRDELLAAEVALRDSIEQVSALRRQLPLGGEVENYQFRDAQGAVSLSDLFGNNDTLIIYSYMYGPNDETPLPNVQRVCRLA